LTFQIVSSDYTGITIGVFNYILEYLDKLRLK
jgi:hypothetical protein